MKRLCAVVIFCWKRVAGKSAVFSLKVVTILKGEKHKGLKEKVLYTNHDEANKQGAD